MDVVSELLGTVVTHSNAPLFSEQAVREVLAQLQREGCGAEGRDLVVEAIRRLAESGNVSLSDVCGQVLWRNRRAHAIRECSRLRRLADDFSWLTGPAFEDDTIAMVEGVFRLFGEGGRMKWRGWQRAMQLILRNPVLHGRVKNSDADRLFYNLTRRNVPPRVSISVHEFKELLLELAVTSSVHPRIVFLAVGSHMKHLTEEVDAAAAE